MLVCVVYKSFIHGQYKMIHVSSERITYTILHYIYIIRLFCGYAFLVLYIMHLFYVKKIDVHSTNSVTVLGNNKRLLRLALPVG